MRQNPHVRICGGPGSATTLVYPTVPTVPRYLEMLNGSRRAPSASAAKPPTTGSP